MTDSAKDSFFFFHEYYVYLFLLLRDKTILLKFVFIKISIVILIIKNIYIFRDWRYDAKFLSKWFKKIWIFLNGSRSIFRVPSFIRDEIHTHTHNFPPPPNSFYSNDSPAKVIFPQSFRLKITFILRYLIEITFVANEIIHFFVHLNKQASDY